MVERITVVAELIDNITGKTRKIVNSVSEMGSGIKKVTTVTQTFNKEGMKVSDVIQKKIIRGFHRFRMELLSVMFFGMALWRMFTGLLQPALDMYGIFDLISTTLAIVFAPAAELLLSILLPILEWFMDLPDDVKLAIGLFVILGSVLALVMMVIGQFGLGLQGIQMLLQMIPGTGIPVIDTILKIGTGIGIAALAMKAWEIFEPLVSSLWKKVTGGKGVFETLGTVVSKIGNLIGTSLEDMGIGVGDLGEGFKETFSRAEDFMTSFKNVAMKVWDTFEDSLKKAGYSLSEFLDELFKLFDKMIELVPIMLDFAIIAMPPLIQGFTLFLDILKEILPFLRAFIDLFKIGYDLLKVGGDVITGGFRGLGAPVIGWEAGPWGIPIPKTVGWAKGIATQYGGIVNKPQLRLVGEAGPEAIVPLNRAGGYGSTIYNSPSFHISASVSNDIDIRTLASKLSEYMFTDLRRLTGGF